MDKEKRAVLITAGPTREAIDPIRYITNHSSGKMGYAIAEAFLDLGYPVVLVSGPVNIALEHPDLTVVQINTADEMHAACSGHFDQVAVAVFAAAVADYKPAIVHQEKLKKSDEEFNLLMVKNVDIAYEFGRQKKETQVAVGFALETNEEDQNAVSKLQRKNLDLVILNSTRDTGATFGFDTNKITIIDQLLRYNRLPLKTKKAVGVEIAVAALDVLRQKLETT
ncbi:phosphopantothenoylcysteine decarboxylase [Mucilaginibacter sp.]|jgi:phosphopantothenoylcysteine decarboxylase/phosphopantothenate--cysteine ligase|uniref:phosphopantothenoylcysteine decarboxylase domain-containing protein n=1 Tax=Mucilaginibacter sp. TaxID=1882438 RepID=UPI003566D8C8